MAALIVKNTFGLLLCMAFLNVVASQQLREKLGERNLYAEAPRQSYMQSSQQGIVGGSVADKGEYPFYAAFKPLICGGSLIAPNVVLTAAHCVERGAPDAVRIGATNRTDGEEIEVLCAVMHPEFFYDFDGDLMNDVAVLKLARNATNVTPIALNNNIDYPSARLTPLNVIGFGATREGGSVSPVLKELGTFFETIESCQNTYPDVRKGVHVCADVANQGDCQGDSGGPLFDNNNTQIGIVSYGIGCARRQEDVYASVGGFYNWIQAQIMAEDICNPVETDDDNFIDENALDLGDVVGSLSRLCEAVSWAFQGIIGFFRGG